ncbi:MAG TPA: polyphenol oxidase family protein [Solirubrobacteraceae bacterium]|nr:polyphenol oxidase family protein [Solirubrobacteraceae bacterium]
MTARAPRGVEGEALSFELPGGGRALFTTRAEGNLSILVGPGADRGEATRGRLREALGLGALAHSRQVHGTVVRRVGADGGGGLGDEADGHVTDVRGVGVMVLTADCLPVALGAPGAVAMLHAGWRGIAGGVLEEGVRALRGMGRTPTGVRRGSVMSEGSPAGITTSEVSPSGIVAVIGPGAGPCCYEVGEEVHEAFGGRRREGRRLDLRGIARERLLAAGVSRVEVVQRCTICDERMFSHRRQGPEAGRQAGIAWLS